MGCFYHSHRIRRKEREITSWKKGRRKPAFLWGEVGSWSQENAVHFAIAPSVYQVAFRTPLCEYQLRKYTCGINTFSTGEE